MNGSKIESIHLLSCEIQFKHKGFIISASPFKIKREHEDSSSKDFQKIIEQNNYTNTILQTIGNQLSNVDATISNVSNFKKI